MVNNIARGKIQGQYQWRSPCEAKKPVDLYKDYSTQVREVMGFPIVQLVRVSAEGAMYINHSFVLHRLLNKMMLLAYRQVQETPDS
jgi:hypothetical protein